MKVTFNVDEVTPFLQLALQLINKKNSIPILDNVLLEVCAGEGSMNLYASDSDSQIRARVPVIESDSSEKIFVDAARLNKILSQLSGKAVIIETNETTKEIKGIYDGGEFSMTYESDAVFPEIKTDISAPETRSVAMSPKAILSGLKDTIFATSDDEIRITMNGVYFDISTDGVVFVGTDGRVLSKHTETKVFAQSQYGFILPKKPAYVILSYLERAQTENNFMVYSDGRVAIFDGGDFVLTTRLIEGRYPNYNSVIPKEFAHNIIVERKTLLGALARTMVFQSSAELVLLSLSPECGELICQDLDYATSGKERFSYVQTTMNGEVEIGFKSSMLVSILKNIETPNVCLCINNGTSAALVVPCDGTNKSDNIMYLIMPMKIS